MTLTERAIDIAVSQIGTKEVGRNRGLKVEAYQASVGLPAGSPWCAAFVYWCYEQAAEQAGVRNPVPRTGGVHKMFLRGRKLQCHGPGQGIFFHDSGAGLGHCGFVTSINGDTLHTIEGNTNEDGSREGNAVARKTRPISYANLGFLIFADKGGPIGS